MIATLLARKVLTSVLGAAVQAVAQDAHAPVITPLNADAVEKALVDKAVQIRAALACRSCSSNGGRSRLLRVLACAPP